MRGNGRGDKEGVQVIPGIGENSQSGNGPAPAKGSVSAKPQTEGTPSGGTNGPAGKGAVGNGAASNGGQPVTAAQPTQGAQQAQPAQAAQANGMSNQPAAEASPKQPATSGAGDRSRVRRARLRTVRFDPWSVMKTAFLLSIAFGIVTVVAVGVIWQVLDTAGVYDSLNRTVADVLSSGSAPASEKFDVMNFIGLQKVLGFATLIAVVDVVLITALATLGAFLYNLSASLLGGVEVTLAEDE